jgi:hypothetical protein
MLWAIQVLLLIITAPIVRVPLFGFIRKALETLLSVLHSDLFFLLTNIVIVGVILYIFVNGPIAAGEKSPFKAFIEKTITEIDIFVAFLAVSAVFLTMGVVEFKADLSRAGISAFMGLEIILFVFLFLVVLYFFSAEKSAESNEVLRDALRSKLLRCVSIVFAAYAVVLFVLLFRMTGLFGFESLDGLLRFSNVTVTDYDLFIITFKLFFIITSLVYLSTLRKYFAKTARYTMDQFLITVLLI